jgi:hypothetical protein
LKSRNSSEQMPYLLNSSRTLCGTCMHGVFEGGGTGGAKVIFVVGGVFLSVCNHYHKHSEF